MQPQEQGQLVAGPSPHQTSAPSAATPRGAALSHLVHGPDSPQPVLRIVQEGNPVEIGARMQWSRSPGQCIPLLNAFPLKCCMPSLIVPPQQGGALGIRGAGEWDLLRGNVTKLGEDDGSTHAAVCVAPIQGDYKVALGSCSSCAQHSRQAVCAGPDLQCVLERTCGAVGNSRVAARPETNGRKTSPQHVRTQRHRQPL